MLILTIRTDKPAAEIGLYKESQQLAYDTWPAHRQLAETIHLKLEKLLSDNKKSWSQLEGIVCFEGPGSFTGLRIGLTVGNSLAYSLAIPVVSASGQTWLEKGTAKLSAGQNQKIVLPKYGSLAHITKPER